MFEVSYKSPVHFDRRGEHATVKFTAYVLPNEITFQHEMGHRIFAWKQAAPLLDFFGPKWRFSQIDDRREEECLRVVAEKVYEEYLARIVVK